MIFMLYNKNNKENTQKCNLLIKIYKEIIYFVYVF